MLSSDHELPAQGSACLDSSMAPSVDEGLHPRQTETYNDSPGVNPVQPDSEIDSKKIVQKTQGFTIHDQEEKQSVRLASNKAAYDSVAQVEDQ